MNLLNLLTAGATQPGGGLLVILIYVVVFGLMIYLMVVKPQKKQNQKQQEMMETLKPGCSIMTTSGFFGTVIVEFGNNKNCRIPMHKKAIAEIEDPDSVTE